MGMILDESKRISTAWDGPRVESGESPCMHASNRFPENLFLDYPVESTEMADTRTRKLPNVSMNRIQILPTKFAFKDH
jgi:hypothetical protein